MKTKKQEKLFTVRAYCSVCGKILMESNPFTKKELMERWDDAVLGAALIPCPDCHPEVPNFNINLKIYNKATDKEMTPEQLLPTPQNRPDLGLPDFMQDTIKKLAKG